MEFTVSLLGIDSLTITPAMPINLSTGLSACNRGSSFEEDAWETRTRRKPTAPTKRKHP
jgi:hypothetical protein